MVLNVSLRTSKLIESARAKAMDELNEFFEVGWVRNTPHVFLVKNRKTIDSLRGVKTKDWVIGFCRGRDVYVLNPKSWSAETSHDYSEDKFAKLIKHELCHLFINMITKANNLKPLWLIEGACVYLSGQYGRYKKSPFLKSFLSFYSFSDKPNYEEAGFAVKFLIEKYGKQKFFRLLKSLKEYQTLEKFEQVFKEIYGFKLDYENFKNEV